MCCFFYSLTGTYKSGIPTSEISLLHGHQHSNQTRTYRKPTKTGATRRPLRCRQRGVPFHRRPGRGRIGRHEGAGHRQTRLTSLYSLPLWKVSRAARAVVMVGIRVVGFIPVV